MSPRGVERTHAPGLILPYALALLLVQGLRKVAGEGHGLDGDETSSTFPSGQPGQERTDPEVGCVGGSWSPTCPSEQPTTRWPTHGGGAWRANFSGGQMANTLQVTSEGTVHLSSICLLVLGVSAALFFLCLSCWISFCFWNKLRLQRSVEILNEQLRQSQVENVNNVLHPTTTSTTSSTPRASTEVTYEVIV